MSPRRALLATLLVPLVSSCAGGPAPATPGAGAEAGWEELLRPRPEPLPGAPRVTVTEIGLVPEDPWGVEAPLPSSVGVAELIAANLLRRRDVSFVERRRFAAAAERERRGLPRPGGAPPAGVSAGAEYLLAGTWSALLGDSATLDLRLVDAGTGASRAAWRLRTPRDADPVALARAATGGLLAALDSLGRLPGGDVAPPPATYRTSGVPTGAFAAFLRGVAAEDAYRWVQAREAYRTALGLAGPGLWEADEALARVARLRAGGSLGASP